MTSGFRSENAVAFARDHWRSDVLPLLEEFARIPNLSPDFDPDWESAGHMDEAAELMAAMGTFAGHPGSGGRCRAPARADPDGPDRDPRYR